ncbi:hypothetical protein ABPG77_005880 [Micractinium sp. CCAP 211/92]
MRLLSSHTMCPVASTSGRQPTSRSPAPAPLPSRCWAGCQAAGVSQPLPAQQQQAGAAPPAAAAAAAPRPHRRRRGPAPARVTNERREINDPDVLKGTDLDPNDAGWVTVDPENPLPNPQLGDMERTIGLPYEEALFLDDVDAEAQAYWFTEPEGGWQTEKLRLRRMEEVPDQEAEAEDEFRHTGPDAVGRTPLSELREGAVVEGEVVANMFYHGAQVDIGAEWDALLPIDEEEWQEVGTSLAPGTRLQLRIHRVRDEQLFRFPIQLAAIDPALAEMVMAPEEHKPPMDLRVLTMPPEEIAARSEGQRVWTPEKVYLETQGDFSFRTGADLSEPDSRNELSLSQQQLALMDSIVDQAADLL